MQDPAALPNYAAISRREAVRRSMILLGGALSAPTLAGVLAGCERPEAGSAWRPATLTGGHDELVATIAEHILPTTETPGARAARVHEFIDVMLTEYYPQEPRDRFLAGLERIEARTRRRHGVGFFELDEEQQLAIVTEMNRLAFEDPPSVAAAPGTTPAHQQHEETARIRDQPPLPDAHELDNDPWDPQDVGREAFFRTLKELVVVGYYTSEIGATQELRLMPMGVYLADVPYDEIGQAWV